MAQVDDERQRAVQVIRTYIARERISRETFAQRTKLGKSTVDKLLVGLFSEKTLLQVEVQLGLNLRTATGVPSRIARDDLGRYHFEDVQKYLGSYLLARPSFRDDNAILAFELDIVWDNKVPGLSALEKVSPESPNQPQIGILCMPRSSMHVFVFSNEQGWLKSAILTQLDGDHKMKGIMLTMGHVFGNTYMPVASPVLIQKMDGKTVCSAGVLFPDSTDYKKLKDDLASVEKENYARWFTYSV